MALLRTVGASLALCLAAHSALSRGISVNTSAFTGIDAQLVFDFIDGGSPNNSATVSGFATNGQLGTFISTGAVTGTLPATLAFSDSAFLSEYKANIKLGSFFSFVLSATMAAPDFSSFPDTFSLFIIDPTTGFALFPTSDPTSANTLFLVEIDGTPQGVITSYSTNVTITSVPEPPSFWLILAGLCSLTRRIRNSRLES